MFWLNFILLNVMNMGLFYRKIKRKLFYNTVALPNVVSLRP